MSTIIHIKNMVCPRCIKAVEDTLNALEIPHKDINLGQVELKDFLSKPKWEILDAKLTELGFELLSDASSKLITEVKAAIIQQIHHNEEPLTVNFSDYLSEILGYDYQYLSRLFSSVEGMTINRYVVVQKIEKVKELLTYDELSTAEIADLLNYNSVAYLSTVFKKETGMTISQFKELQHPSRKGIDKI